MFGQTTGQLEVAAGQDVTVDATPKKAEEKKEAPAMPWDLPGVEKKAPAEPAPEPEKKEPTSAPWDLPGAPPPATPAPEDDKGGRRSKKRKK